MKDNLLDLTTEIIWITSSSRIQKIVLNRILNMGYKSKVILEKPYALNLEENHNLKGLIRKFPNQIFFSAVWRHSNLWQSFTTEKLSDADYPTIDICRVGDKLREGISPILDWAPHDMYLIANYLQDKRSQIIPETIEFKMDYQHLSVNFDVHPNVKISLTSGYSETRNNYWQYNDGNGRSFRLDFYRNELIKTDLNMNSSETIMKFNDLSILSFIKWVAETHKDNSAESILELSELLLFSNQEGRLH